MELDSDRKCHAVAEKFGLSEDQRKIMEIAGEKRRDSATKAMFTALEARGNNEPFLKKLVGILVSLGLRDIVDNWDWNTNERKSNGTGINFNVYYQWQNKRVRLLRFYVQHKQSITAANARGLHCEWTCSTLQPAKRIRQTSFPFSVMIIRT